MKQLLLLTVISFSILNSSFSQGTVEIARWKNNATAAYSIISDDYNMPFWGNFSVVQPSLADRGIRMSFATVTQYSNHWDEARDILIPDGHDLISHSPDHNWHENTPDTLEWICDGSQAAIESNVPGSECLFIANWGGMNATGMQAYLKTRRFIGCRGIGSSTSGVNTYDFDPFEIGTFFYQAGQDATLQSKVDDAISNGGFAQMSFHYIGGTISWGYIEQTNWISHLDYIKTKMDANELWVETVQTVIKYRMEREYYTTSITSENSDSLVIAFDTSAEINPSALVDNSTYDEFVTLIVTNMNADEAIFNADPFGGDVVVKYNASNITEAYQGSLKIYPEPGISLDIDVKNIDYISGSFDLTITSTDGWEVSTDADWLSFSASSGLSTDESLTITYDENTVAQVRLAYVNVSYNDIVKTLQVIQDEAAVLTLSDYNFNVASAGESSSFIVLSNGPWSISCDQTWVSFATTSGSGNLLLDFTVEANTTADTRTATITVATSKKVSRTISISQEGSALGIDNEFYELSIYPIPAHNYINIQSDIVSNTATLNIYNIDGSIAKQTIISNSNQQVDISDLPSGMYSLTINNRKTVLVSKFVKF